MKNIVTQPEGRISWSRTIEVFRMLCPIRVGMLEEEPERLPAHRLTVLHCIATLWVKRDMRRRMTAAGREKVWRVMGKLSSYSDRHMARSQEEVE